MVKQRELLYTGCFGSSPSIYHSTDRMYPHVDIYHFAPFNSRSYHVLITGGMADYCQPVDVANYPARIELLICISQFRWWTANLLKILGEFPAQNKTFLAAYHTVPIGYNLTETSQISAFLLAPEFGCLSEAKLTVENAIVEYFRCLPITWDELEYARKYGGEELFAKLVSKELLVHKDDERKSVFVSPG